MSRALAVAGREFKASLTSPLGYVFLLLFVLATLLVFFFFEGFFGANQATARGLFRWLPPLLLFVTPALTMRLWADERKMGTYELLATLPIPPWQLVCGKFLAAFGLLAFALVLTLGAPIVAEIYGDLDWGPVVGGYVGALLLGSAYLAIGLVCSLLVQEQLLALFLGFLLCGATLLPDVALRAGWVGDSLAEFCASIGFWARFASIERGVLDLRDLVFYLSATGFFLYLNVALVRWRRFTT
ncbi:MAG: ABC transporter permease subunit [Planctomycetes bacterium]|nr:ABC transporter permease subunit [Planctomycetota bacterium]